MLMPKKTRYRKQQRGRMRGKSWTGQTVAFGDFGLKTLEPGWITNRQIESARVAITRFIKRTGRVWIRIFPDKPLTKKPQETRMGKGKGGPEGWVRRGASGTGPLRNGRRRPRPGHRGDAPGGPQASGADAVRRPL